MSSQHLCPFCSSPLLCQITDGNLSWYCRHCHLDIPYGVFYENEHQNEAPDGMAQNSEKSTLKLLRKNWQKTLTDIKEAIQADRVMLWQYNQQGELKVLEEVVNPDYPSMKDWLMGHFFTKQELTEFNQGKIQITSDLTTVFKDNLLESFFEVKAKLVAPIILPNHDHDMPKLWGLLLVHHCAQPHHWQELEIKLVSIIAKQMGLSIEQAEDYQKLEKSNYINPATYVKSNENEEIEKQYCLDTPGSKLVKSSCWEDLSNIEQLRSYIGYFLSRGKTIISPVSGPLYFRGLVYQYRGYHLDFIYFWQQLRLRKDFLDLYLQGDRYSFNDFLTGSFCIGECARCNLPIPVPVGSAYDIPHCDLCNTYEHIESEYLFKVIAIAQPLAQLLQLQQLCAANRILLTCIATPQALTPTLWEDPPDLILIDSQISSRLAQKWAEKIHEIPELVTVPIIALSKQAGNGITSFDDSEQELTNYLLNPLNGKHLAKYLREISHHLFLNVKQEHLNWFPA